MTSTGTSDPIDPSMLELFRAEVDTHLPVLSDGLLALEKDPSQTKRFEALMRAAHSIKGAARIIGLDLAVALAHALEDSMVAAQAGRFILSSEAIEVLLRGVDALARIAQITEGTPAEQAGSVRQLIDQITAVQKGTPAPAPAPTPTPPSPQSVVVGGDSAEQPPLTPSGNLDRSAAEELRRILVDLLDRGLTGFHFDLGRVEDIEPVGLAVLAVLPRMVQRRGVPTTLRMAMLRPDVCALLRMTQLDRDYQLGD